MANEIRTATTTGLTLTAKVYYDVAGTMTQRGGTISLTEFPAASGIYAGDAPVGYAQGDSVVILDGSTIIGSTVYSPDCAADLISVNLDAAAAANLEATYDGTGYTDPNGPAKQSQLDNLANTGSAINTPADSYVLTTGTQVSGTYTDTAPLDAVHHQHADAIGVMDLYYEFLIGGDGVPVSAQLTGRLNGNNDNLEVFAYNWGSTSWDKVGELDGQAGSTDIVETYNLYTSHVGTGVDKGKVRIRFTDGIYTLTAANLYIDQLFVSYSVVTRTVGYANGMVWIDTTNGTAGTELYVNGTADNPVLSYADAETIAAGIGLNAFHIAQGSSITFTGTFENKQFEGLDYILNLGGVQINNCTITGAVIFGIATGDGGSVLLERCKFGDCTLPEVAIVGSAFSGTITFNEAGTYFFDRCASAVAGTSAPVFDFGVAVGSVNLNIRHYSGGVDIRNMGQLGTDKMSLEGHGQLILNVNCVDGLIALRGHFAIVDDTDGAIEIVEDANFKSTVVHAGVAQGPGAGTNQIQLSVRASAVDGAYDPSMIMIVIGTGAGQSRLIYEYDGTTKTATVDRDWKVAPDSTSEYRVLAHTGREHVNEGLARGGTSNSITLNALAADGDNVYKQQIVFLKSGKGADQVGLITAYDGTTKVATIEGTWENSIPDSTTGYAIIATHEHTLDDIVGAIFAALDVTEGGTWTFRKAVKMMTAFAAGNWRDKSGDPTKKELLDPDDGTTVILEAVLQPTSPYVQVTVLI